MKKKIVIIGAGFGLDEIFPLVSKSYNVVAILDDNEKLYKKFYNKIPIHIGIEKAKDFKNVEFVFAIGSHKNKNLRERIFKRLNIQKELFSNIIDKSAIIHSNVKIGYGNIINAHTIICSNSIINDFCVLTYSNIIAHGVFIDSFTLFGSRTSILNLAKIGRNVFIGANVLVAENISIANNASIIMGSVVLSNVPKNKIAYGFPAKFIS